MAKDKLYNLVHSLSNSEKKFFRQYAKRWMIEAEAGYLKLYDAIEAQEEYSEALLKNKFPSYEKNFHKAKAYLYDLILKSLVIQQEKTSSYTEALYLLSTVEILSEKMLINEALEQIKKVKDIAEAYDFNELKFATYRWEYALIATSTLTYAPDDLSFENYEEKLAVIRQISDITEMRQYYFQLSELSGSKTGALQPEMFSQIKDIYDKPMLADNKEYGSKSIQRLYLGLKYMQHKFMGKKKEALEYIQQLAALCEKFSMRFYFHEFQLIYCYYNLINEYLENECQQEAGHYLEKLRQLSVNTEPNRYFQFHLLFSNELNYHTKYGNTKACMKLIKEYYSSVNQRTKESFHREVEVRNYYSIMNYLVQAKEYSEALTFINVLLNERSKEVQALPYFKQAKLLNLVAHFELGNYDLLEHIVRQTEYFLTTRKLFFQFEKSLLNFFRQAAKPDILVKECYKGLQHNLKGIMQDSAEMLRVQFFNQCGWLNHHKVAEKLQS
ncbi:MAG: hypothetical protein H0W62_08520 [Chitinophagales bacterium]|nr:hypothetical protein [Chitinophagales bacterium]